MAETIDRRHRLHNKLDEVLGPDDAQTVMDALERVGWGDVATKQDLEILRLDFRAELQREVAMLQRNLFFAFVSAQLGFAALILGFG